MDRNGRYVRRRRRRINPALIVLACVLAVVLAVLLVFMLWSGEPDVALHPEITMEAGNELPPASKFLAEQTEVSVSYGDFTAVNQLVPGVYPVTLLCDGFEKQASIRVVDTTPPMGTAQDVTVFGTAIPKPEEFVTGIRDVTNVTVSYLTAPEGTLAGEQTVTVVLTDAAGNTTKLQAKLTRTIDEIAPTITGAQDITIYQGDTVQYMKDIVITDDQDPEPKINVERGSVDLNKPGEYTVTYVATDKAGNVTRVQIKITVLPKEENYVPVEQIYKEVDDLLATLITPEMDAKTQAYKVYYWIRTNCGYDTGTFRDDWLQAAHAMLTTKKGDCFNYFALCKLMLNRLGNEDIVTIDVHKVKNYDTDSNHYWSLVSIDGGQTYYHLDTTPRKEYVNLFMRCDKFMDEYSTANNNCFNRDKSLYPATPETDLEPEA